MTETAAVGTPFSALHARFVERRAAPTWLALLRAREMARFEELGLPSPRNEDWRHTSVAPIARASFGPAGEAIVDDTALQPLRLGAHEAVFVNGRFSPALSSLSGLPAGARVESLARVLADSDQAPEGLGQVVPKDGHAFTALNTAFLEDGAAVHLAPRTVVPKPIHIVYFSTSPKHVALSHPRTVVTAGAGSQARIIETYAGPSGEAYFTNAVTEIALSEGAVVEHYKVQRESELAFHVGRIEARQERQSQFASYSLSFGGALVRTDIGATLAGEGADCGMYGLFLGRGAQHMDHHTVIDHAVPHCTSRELYKGVLDERSRGVFFGTIIVRKGAQKTDAHQTNKNLLLSREALVNSTPRLQIEADDVRCKHGSTTGQLDPVALFYLRSRGVGEAEAKNLLTYAFAADVIERITDPALKRSLGANLVSRLPGVSELVQAAS
jgi:Fe-S cluster assembly protein SufD